MPLKVHAPDRRSPRESDGEATGPFALAFEASPVPMALLDARRPDAPIAFVNDALVRLTGYSREELTGKTMRLLERPETKKDAVRAIREACESLKDVTVRLVFRRKDSAPFPASVTIRAVRDGAGQAWYLLGTFAEVPDLPVEHGTNSPRVLEDEVSRRTEALREALDRRNALLHEIDHRAKNSLQVISSLVLLKARRIQDEQAKDALFGLADRVSALATAHRLLQPQEEGGTLDLGEFMNDLLADLTAPLPPGRIVLDLRVEPVALLAARAPSLALLMNELVSNVLKHAFPADRSGRLSVTASRAGSGLRIAVEDDGIGLAGGAPTGDSFGKTLIDMLVRQLRAQIAWEDASPGTRVVVTLPLGREEIVS